jgi:hypothetical protein
MIDIDETIRVSIEYTTFYVMSEVLILASDGARMASIGQSQMRGFAAVPPRDALDRGAAVEAERHRHSASL